MSAADEITSAIRKLEGLAYESSDGPWIAHVSRDEHEMRAELFDANGGYVIADGYTADVGLVEMLHRTIDAQLAILSGTLGLYAEFVEQGRESVWLSAVERAGDLDLARAINGSA